MRPTVRRGSRTATRPKVWSALPDRPPALLNFHSLEWNSGPSEQVHAQPRMDFHSQEWKSITRFTQPQSGHRLGKVWTTS